VPRVDLVPKPRDDLHPGVLDFPGLDVQLPTGPGDQLDVEQGTIVIGRAEQRVLLGPAEFQLGDQVQHPGLAPSHLPVNLAPRSGLVQEGHDGQQVEQRQTEVLRLLEVLLQHVGDGRGVEAFPP